MTVQFAQIKSRIRESENCLTLDSQNFTGTIHRVLDGLKRQTSYQNGKKHGLQKTYHQNGALYSICNYNNGLLDGRFIEYWPTGAKKMHITYANGLKEGPCEEWDQDGMIASLKTYFHDKLVCIKPKA